MSRLSRAGALPRSSTCSPAIRSVRSMSTANSGRLHDLRPSQPRRRDSPWRWSEPNSLRNGSIRRRLCCRPTGTFGNAGRNILDGPGFEDIDFSLSKNTDDSRELLAPISRRSVQPLQSPELRAAVNNVTAPNSA